MPEDSFEEDEELRKIKEKKIKELVKKSREAEAGGVKNIVMLNEESFDSFVSGSTTPVLIDFFATWCPPCKMMEPVMEKLAEEFAGKIAFGKVDVDENMNLVSRFDITAVPTFILFKKGKVVGRVVGARNYETFKKMLEKVLAR
ncbi:MAG: thioredoxin [Candidatus Jordarchaeales archaeon]